MYVEDPIMAFVRPWKRLLAFGRITLAPGESTTVQVGGLAVVGWRRATPRALYPVCALRGRFWFARKHCLNILHSFCPAGLDAATVVVLIFQTLPSEQWTL